MKKAVFGLTFGAVLALAPGAIATPTNAVDLYNTCMADGSAHQSTVECTVLQEKVNAAIRDCMHPSGVQTAKAKSSHGYKAQYLICSASARQKFGTIGH